MKSGDADTPDVIESEVVSAIKEGVAHRMLDKSIRLRTGQQHGDLHSRNVLAGPNGIALIDFGESKTADEGGIPLIDVARLVVDLAIFSERWRITDILSGAVLQRAELEPIVRSASGVGEGLVSEEERDFFCAAAECVPCSPSAGT